MPEEILRAERAAPASKPARRTVRRVKPPTREEAENAEAWWVKKG